MISQALLRLTLLGWKDGSYSTVTNPLQICSYLDISQYNFWGASSTVGMAMAGVRATWKRDTKEGPSEGDWVVEIDSVYI